MKRAFGQAPFVWAFRLHCPGFYEPHLYWDFWLEL
jgi:hypothetical protein